MEGNALTMHAHIVDIAACERDELSAARPKQRGQMNRKWLPTTAGRRFRRNQQKLTMVKQCRVLFGHPGRRNAVGMCRLFTRASTLEQPYAGLGQAVRGLRLIREL